MKLLIFLLAISRLSECSLQIPYHGVTVGITPYSAPVNSHSQYHAQDIHGHYAYGYATDLSAQDEVKTRDGVTRGGYSYIDANGILQTVQYVSDPVHGFRVAATNLPQDLPEVAAARAQHLAQFEYVKAEHAAIAASRAHLPAAISPIPEPGTIVVPVRAAAVYAAPVVDAPVAFTPSVVAISSQYHAQDGHGQYSYGYADPLSAKTETKTADGVTRGGYSYIDANGILQTVQYISDPVNGFRVAATNLPQAPSVTLIGPKITATVVGPTDNNAASVAVAAPDAVLASAVNVVSAPALAPVADPGETHIDSIAFEQRPVLTQADIVQNANIPLAGPVHPGPYIQPNPNHEPVSLFPSPRLGSPLQPPIPIAHSQAVLRGQTHPAPHFSSAYAPHNNDGALIHPNVPSQFLLAPEPYNPGLENIPYPDGGALPISAAQNNYFAVGADPRGSIPSDDNSQTNVQQGVYPIALNPDEYQTNYQTIPINTEPINNGPINQQVLNRGEGPARVPLFVPDVAAQQVQHQYQVQAQPQVSVGNGGGGGDTRAQVSQPFIVRVAEQESVNTAQLTARDEGPQTPSGYYTQNIQY